MIRNLISKFAVFFFSRNFDFFNSMHGFPVPFPKNTHDMLLLVCFYLDLRIDMDGPAKIICFYDGVGWVIDE